MAARILVVDNDPNLTQFIQVKLRQEGAEVTALNSGIGAYDLAKAFKPDILLCDVKLPGVCGYSICRQVRRDPELYKMGILMMTMFAEEPEQRHGLNQGADILLGKPIRVDHLHSRIVALQEHQQRVFRKEPHTGLLSMEALKREANHRLAREEALGMAYVDVVGLMAHAQLRGKDLRGNVLRMTAECIRGVQTTHNITACEAAYLGGSYFAVIVKGVDLARFCQGLAETFDAQAIGLQSAREAQKEARKSDSARVRARQAALRGAAMPPPICLAISAVNTQGRRYCTANSLFEELQHTRLTMPPAGRSLIAADKRRVQ